MRINLKKFFVFISIALPLSMLSCTQIMEMATFSRCEFKLNTVENILLAGVNVQRVKSINDLSLLDAAKITSALASGPLNLSLDLNVGIRNPNSARASLNRLDWILLIDDSEIVNGTSNEKVDVPPSGQSTMRLQIATDLKKSATGKSGTALANLGLNLAGAGNTPTRITLRAKPHLYVGGRLVSYPGYFDIKTTFTSGGSLK